MPIRYSHIHAMLGLPVGDLTYAHIQEAVAQHLAESDDLDWKSELPPPKDPAKAEEFAKDIAAMANAGGGLIVFGIREQGGGRADAITSVDVSEGAQRTLRQLAAEHLRPFVAGIDMLPLTGVDGDVLVVSVPASPMQPHLLITYRKDQAFKVPMRYGPETRYMGEPEIERSYGRRLAGYSQERDRLSALAASVRDHLLPSQESWIIGVAAPAVPLPAHLPVPRAQDIRGQMEQLLLLAQEVHATGGWRFSPIRELEQAAFNPRPGLRRWIMRKIVEHDGESKSHFSHVEIHHDGAVVLAVPVKEETVTGYRPVFVPNVESFSADFVALSAMQSRSQSSATAPYGFLVDLAGPSDLPFAVFEPETRGGSLVNSHRRVPGSNTVARFTPILGELPVLASTESLRLAARELSLDVLHQFGVTNLYVWPTHLPPGSV